MPTKAKPRAKANGKRSRKQQQSMQFAQLVGSVAAEVGEDEAATAAAMDAQFQWALEEMRTGDFRPVRLTCLGTFKPLIYRINESIARRAAAAAAAAAAAPPPSKEIGPGMQVVVLDEQTRLLALELRQTGALDEFTADERRLLFGV